MEYLRPPFVKESQEGEYKETKRRLGKEWKREQAEGKPEVQMFNGGPDPSVAAATARMEDPSI